MYPSLIYLDRYHNEGTRNYSDQAGYTEALEQYRPNAETPWFKLTPFSLRRDMVNIYTAGPHPKLEQQYLPGNQAIFCIHPQVLQSVDHDPFLQTVLQAASPLPPIPVIPSSSTRTLYVDSKELPAHALKVHFPFKVSRYSRKMRDEVIEQAINVSLELEHHIAALDENFAFLREVLGLSIKQQQIVPKQEMLRGEHWGYLVREMTPFPQSTERRYLIPGFALHGANYFAPNTPPLLIELIASRHPLEYLLEQLMFPIIRHWVHCYLLLGYMLEPHGQNVLLEVNVQGDIQRVVHRDLSVGIDMRRRRDQGLPEENLNMYNRMETGAFLSITYDMFMGHHFFDPVIACAQKYFPTLQRKDFLEPCRTLFGNLFPDHDAYMPPTVHYFSSQRDAFGKPFYQDTCKKPTWRP
ncbi:MAG: hypothetical protein CSA33_06905 [Desulfobulbus propionicus]|nr:MAG: hypothetical protein CSA33_06905 [Desulfobulbus propionicus]